MLFVTPESGCCPWNQNAAVVYFYSATSRRYRAVMWSIFAPALRGARSLKNHFEIAPRQLLELTDRPKSAALREWN
jgi:hypothetical protein